jgi:hypothetical protein
MLQTPSTAAVAWQRSAVCRGRGCQTQPPGSTLCSLQPGASCPCRGWKLDYILNTHHHWDHTGGNQALKAQHNLQVSPGTWPGHILVRCISNEVSFRLTGRGLVPQQSRGADAGERLRITGSMIGN